ncbi:MAG: c-type cytochrome [Chitinophagaceae bacterium]|nr:c-type cytochrome [Chitinophagaceae bacterium]
MSISLNGNRKKILILGLMISSAVGGCRFYFQRNTHAFTALKVSGSLQNGKNLAQNICAGCHYDESTKKYTGIALGDLPRIGGKLYSANLTHSSTHGIIDQYSDAELMYLLKTGIARNGKFMPYMMRPTMADADMNDLILYFRSNDAPLTPGDVTAGRTKINFFGKIGMRSASKPSPYIKNIARPDQRDQVDYGYYLSSVIGCYHCHSKKISGINSLEPEKSKGYMMGGMKGKDFNGKHTRAANLTPDKETGIGNFTASDFRKAVREGIAPDGEKISTAMPRFTNLTNKQADALFAYLSKLPPVRHAVQ